ALRGELLARRYGSGVRLEVADNCPDELINFLLRQFELDNDDLYRVQGPVNLTRMMAVLGDVDRPELLYRPFTPSVPKGLKGGSLFSAIANNDILLHHPFQAYSPIEA
ncbi:RNA degradosome polyphosphate kinase, partial [Guyparkeria sp. 1SP6A2]|nr:RNA degradosome polyphosphate kinase [Guyparkeria sp. 1SP6A2]